MALTEANHLAVNSRTSDEGRASNKHKVLNMNNTIKEAAGEELPSAQVTYTDRNNNEQYYLA